MPPSTSTRIIPARGKDAPAHLGNLGQHAGNELLTAKPGIDGHQQHQVDFFERVIEPVQRRGRIERQPGTATLLAYQRDGAIDVFARLGVKADVRGAGAREIRHDAIDRAHHQVNIDRHRHAVLAQRGTDLRPDREVGHVMVVHHIEVHQVGAGANHRVHFSAEARKVGGQYRWRDPGSGHGL